MKKIKWIGLGLQYILLCAIVYLIVNKKLVSDVVVVLMEIGWAMSIIGAFGENKQRNVEAGQIRKSSRLQNIVYWGIILMPMLLLTFVARYVQ